MDCRRFKDRHLAYMDNTLSEAELVEMERHRAECAACSQLDTSIRRALLVFRNLPCIQPSPDFTSRLSARIQQLDHRETRQPQLRLLSPATFTAVAASLLMVGILAVAGNGGRVPEIALAPVVATQPDTPLPLLVDHTFVTSVSSGLPVWPAAVLAEEAPLHFMDAELRWEGR
ncbi:MAG TPA: zf-HC2 domain-containing protein [Gemmatimonadaceae bacterium]|nr:zf-HC2 domain-containing protein [Gemmatimonadaceae bacterium]